MDISNANTQSEATMFLISVTVAFWLLSSVVIIFIMSNKNTTDNQIESLKKKLDENYKPKDVGNANGAWFVIASFIAGIFATIVFWAVLFAVSWLVYAANLFIKN